MSRTPWLVIPPRPLRGRGRPPLPAGSQRRRLRRQKPGPADPGERQRRHAPDRRAPDTPLSHCEPARRYARRHPLRPAPPDDDPRVQVARILEVNESFRR
jgi:hypothetical protein